MSRSNSYLFNIEILNREDLFNKVFLSMPHYRREKAEKFRNMANKCRCLGAGIILEKGLSDWFKGDSIELETIADVTDIIKTKYIYSQNISFTDNGKPYYTGGLPYFSLSHSGDYAAGVFSDTPVGIDIQRIAHVSPALYERILSPYEFDIFQKLSEDERQDEFFRIWTAKEAYLKMTGEGITREMKGLTVWDGELIPIFNGCKLIEHHIPRYKMTICQSISDPAK